MEPLGWIRNCQIIRQFGTFRKQFQRFACGSAILLFLTACQTTGGTFCDVSDPIRLSAAQVDQLSDAEVTALLQHNLKGQSLCGWSP